jgi:hypothetical protein
MIEDKDRTRAWFKKHKVKMQHQEMKKLQDKRKHLELRKLQDKKRY